MSHPDPTQEYPCDNCGGNLDDCGCSEDPQVTSKNQFEIAADAYMASVGTLPQIDTALRQAFYAGVQFGINAAQKIYRPELSE